MSLYLWLNVLVLACPLLGALEPRIKYAQSWLALAPAIGLAGCFFVVWDIHFTAAGVWGFNPEHLLGISWWGLPVEEWLFFICIPFAEVLIYVSVRYFVQRPWLSQATAQRLCVGLGLGLLLLAFTYMDRMYTFYNSLFCGLWLLGQGFWWKGRYLPHFFIAYVWHILPFLLVNGVLTGAITERPIVWYNESMRLPLRIGTIPVEDFVYSLFLFLMTVTFYEFFKHVLSLQKK